MALLPTASVVVGLFGLASGHQADELSRLKLDIEPLIGRSLSEIAPILALLEPVTGGPLNVSPPRP